MQIKTYKAYKQDGQLELPLSALAPRLIQTIDRFAEYIEEHVPQCSSSILKDLESRSFAEASIDRSVLRCSGVRGLCSCSNLYRSMPSLVFAHVGLLQVLLGVPGSAWVQEEPALVMQSAFIRARYRPNYLKLLALLEWQPRDRAISLMKGFLDWSIEQLPVRAHGPQHLSALREQQVEFNLQEGGMDWTAVILGDHQYLNKVTRCRIRDVLLESGDPELLEVVACYPDFAMFRHTNPHFMLTRTQTLLSGADCCDSCYHDDRYVPAFRHPPLRVFETLAGAPDA